MMDECQKLVQQRVKELGCDAYIGDNIKQYMASIVGKKIAREAIKKWLLELFRLPCWDSKRVFYANTISIVIVEILQSKNAY